SSPEALGFDLWHFGGLPSPFAACRDEERAADAYDQAEGWLAGIDAPRMRGALALRRAALDWLSGDYTTQKTWLRVAAHEFAGAGDAAGRWLTVVHDLVGDVALGRIATTRSLAGTSFDFEARGPIAAIRHSGQEDGSASWTSGLGKIFQRAADAWAGQGDYPRAELAYELAAPLVPASGAETAAAVLLELAKLDTRFGFGVRALTRSRAAVATLPPISDAARDVLQGGRNLTVDAASDVLQWGRNLSAAGDVIHVALDGDGTAAGLQVAGLDWAIERAQELLALGRAPRSSGGQFSSATRAGVPFAGTPSPMEVAMLEWVDGFADVLRRTVSFAQASASFERGREAAAAGTIGTAERWYDDAFAHLAESPDLARMEVVFLAARDRFDEAQARLQELADTPEQRAELYGIAALRARDYETALRHFGTEPDLSRPWPDLLDHAEAAFGAGEVGLAVTLTDEAVRVFEARLDRLRRDVDRVAACDDTRIAKLYLLAAQAQLASQSSSDGGPERRARAFELSDRGRTLALTALLADASDESDGEQLILAWRQVTSEWQGAHDRLFRAYVTAAGEEEINGRIAALASAEHRLVEVEAQLEDSRGRGRSPTGRSATNVLQDVQEALPRDAALVEYQLVNRDLVVWTVTRTTASAHTSTHATGAVARLAKAAQRGCANGEPGPEAAELAEILLGPLASVADACDRLIVVPYGRLHGLPFHVLPFRGQPLGVTHVLSYLPAAGQLRGVTIDEPLHAVRALVVGDPAFDGSLHPSLKRLPGAELEARAIAETAGVRPLIGVDADEPTIRRELGRCDLVHLAAHGRLDAIAPSDSSIILAGPDELTVSDLVGLRIDSGLVVLSACDSGRGAASLGGDVVGLARGLLAAGVRRAIVSLWPVDDAPACTTMSLFHQHLAEGAPVAVALHAAQRAVQSMSGAEIARRYVDLGGDTDDTASSRRRGASSPSGGSTLPLDPEFVDDLADAEPIDDLGGQLARVWAPFVAIGV
ncbi:MAG TPA: CHAT domain-containing protein, partial [Solirubrobacteraceae bacterium]